MYGLFLSCRILTLLVGWQERHPILPQQFPKV